MLIPFLSSLFGELYNILYLVALFSYVHISYSVSSCFSPQLFLRCSFLWYEVVVLFCLCPLEFQLHRLGLVVLLFYRSLRYFQCSNICFSKQHLEDIQKCGLLLMFVPLTLEACFRSYFNSKILKLHYLFNYMSFYL